MINFYFDDFLNSIKYLDYDDALAAANIHTKGLEKVHGWQEKREARLMAEKLKGLLYWLKTGKRPAKIAPEEFMKYKPICESLVARKQLNSEALKVFAK